MYCSKCGTKLNEHDVFCFECGARNVELNQLSSMNDNFTIDNENYELVDNRVNTPNWWSAPEITKVLIVGNDSRKSASSSVVRGAIGGTLLAPIGIGLIGVAGGLLSGKNRSKTTFLVFYSNGKKKTVICKTNGAEYRHYIKYLE